MKFSELEKIMLDKGLSSLADIARYLNTTPQAVSNWKSRDKVPHHLEIELNKNHIKDFKINSNKIDVLQAIGPASQSDIKEDPFSVSDILLILAKHLKIIFLSVFISIFLVFTHNQFIQEKLYDSYVKVLFPSSSSGSSGGLASLASQFGVEVSGGAQADLSSPSFFPELIKSRTFAEKILEKKFYTEKFKKELPLLAILTYGLKEPTQDIEVLITNAQKTLNGIIKYETSAAFNIIKIITFEPLLAKQLAETVLAELQDLNRFYKNQSVSEKVDFIENRIFSVSKDLEKSEKKLKNFREMNRQINSPALQLEQDRLNRDVEVQKGIFLTLKQQLELAKIESVQQNSIVQILDPPQVALFPFNKNLKRNLILALLTGLGLGVLLAFLRDFLDNDNISERKKLRKVRLFLRKKTLEIFLDYRMSGIISIIMLLCLPLYLGYRSNNPTFFGMYSNKIFILNLTYVLVLIFSITSFLITKRNRK